MAAIDSLPRASGHGAAPRVPAAAGDQPAHSAQHMAEVLMSRLRARSGEDPLYWSFAGNDKRSHGHALFSYPAMMVPQLQGVLLDELLAADPSVRCVYDPFGGSGTVLVESMLRGLDFIGSDINPLAVLIMRAKSYPITEPKLREAVGAVIDRADREHAGNAADEPVEFRGRDKWFKPDVTQCLSRLRAAISSWPGPAVRRFLWVCLAETVRLVSNSRTSTFKLHAYSPGELATWQPDSLAVFAEVAEANVQQMSQQRQMLNGAGLLHRGHYRGLTLCLLADVRDDHPWPHQQLADAVMTSPPYGDNRTTVPYGQHAFLPLSWMNRRDIGSTEVIDELLGSPYRTDVASLGGRIVRQTTAQVELLLERSPQLRATANKLGRLDGNGYGRFMGFCLDLDRAIGAILKRVRPAGTMFWTLGERRVSGIQIPTTRIVAEISASHNASELTVLHRTIPKNAKRMAARNDRVATMHTETILVMQAPTNSDSRRTRCG